MARQDFEHRRLYYKYFVPYALLVLALVAMVSIWLVYKPFGMLIPNMIINAPVHYRSYQHSLKTNLPKWIEWLITLKPANNTCVFPLA